MIFKYDELKWFYLSEIQIATVACGWNIPLPKGYKDGDGVEWKPASTIQTHSTKKRQVPKIKVFNKIHVKHQNTEMARKKNYIYVQITVVFKNITNVFLLFQNFFWILFIPFFFATAAKHSLIVVSFHKKALNSLWKWCALSFAFYC